jgi:hypothetical protein
MVVAAKPAAFDRRDAVWLSAIVVLGVALRWPVLEVGPLSDDYLQHGIAQGLHGGATGPWDLFSLFSADPAVRAEHMATGVVPWWTAPDLYGRVFRPLTSLTLWVDHALLPRAPRLHHAHTLLWWGLALTSVSLLLRRIFDRPVAWTAAIVFALDGGASWPLSWQANRSIVLAAAFGFFALRTHIRWRQDALPRGATRTAIGMALTFACGEYGLIIVGYVLAYEVWLRRANGPQATSWVRTLVPTLGPAAVYVALHVLLGYGTVGSEVYAHPFHDPVGYLHWVGLRVPRLLGELCVSLPAATHELPLSLMGVSVPPSELDLAQARQLHVRVAWAAIVTTAVIYGTVRRGLRQAERAPLCWLFAAAVAGLFVVAVPPSHGRLLLLSHLGSDSLVAAILVGAARLSTGRAGAAWPRRIAAGLIAVMLGLAHGPYAVLSGRTTAAFLTQMHLRARAAVLSPSRQGIDLADKHVIVMLTKVQELILYGRLAADYHGVAVPRSWHVVSTTRAPLNVRRTGPRTLEISHMLDATWLATREDRQFRPPPHGLPAGTEIRTGVFDVTILAAERGRPTKIRLSFPTSVDDPRHVFLMQRGFELVEYRPPPVGGINFVPLPPR